MSDEKRGPDPSRQVPEGLEDTDRLWGRSKSEAITVIGTFFTMMVLSSFVPEAYANITPLFLVFGLVLGVLIVFLTPSHLEPTEWVGAMGSYWMRPTNVPHLSLADGMARDQGDFIKESKVYELNERTQEVTWVECIHKDSNAVERIDGAMIGAIKVDPANMALAEDERWERMIDQWQSYLDHTVQYPLQIYATSVDFPIEDYVSHYQRRVNDPDLQKRPILQELLRDFLDWYPSYIQYRGTKQKQFYLIFTVKEDEVIGSEFEEESITEQIVDIPVIGSKLKPYIKGGDEDDREVKAKQLAELESRIREGRSQGVRPLPNCSSSRLSGFELALLIKEYWESRQFDFETDSVINEHGVSRRGGEPVDPEETSTGSGFQGTDQDV